MNFFSKGQITHVSGRNGIGKSTLLKKLAQQLSRDNIAFSYLGQDRGLLETQRAIEQLNFYQHLLGHDINPWLELLDDIPLRSFVFELSCGQKQRISLACHLRFESAVWILDEPFDALDKEGSTMLQEAFIRFISEDNSIVLVDHTFDLREGLHQYAYNKDL